MPHLLILSVLPFITILSFLDSYNFLKDTRNKYVRCQDNFYPTRHTTRRRKYVCTLRQCPSQTTIRHARPHTQADRDYPNGQPLGPPDVWLLYRRFMGDFGRRHGVGEWLDLRDPMFPTHFFGRIHRSIILHKRTFSIHKPRVLPEFSLHDKVCVVTGAARGLGSVICKAFVES